jgi:predicted AAA+ superfamily ATPase
MDSVLAYFHVLHIHAKGGSGMMEIKRDKYLRKLVDCQWDGQVKVVTGIRRCGKTYLLKQLFRNWLLENGTNPSDILSIDLDVDENATLRNPLKLGSYVRQWLSESSQRKYLFIDEIQFCESIPNPALPDGKRISFYDTLNGLRSIGNLDIYVTGSNSRMLASDVLTEFRGRSDDIRLHPLSFAEFHSATGGDKRDALEEYLRYGGMPFLLSRRDSTAKEAYLQSLFKELYIKDIVERRNVDRKDALECTVDMLCSSVGSLTNPTRVANGLSSAGIPVSAHTVRNYIGYLMDAFLFSELRRYDIKGRAYFDYPSKFYCEDVGLRNARLGWRQQEPTHLMENVVCNELQIRGFSVDVGVVEKSQANGNGNSVRVQREIDFVVNKAGKRLYLQSAWAMPDEEKRQSELMPFSLTGDSFRKIVVRNDIGRRWEDEKGVLHVNLADFLLDETITA